MIGGRVELARRARGLTQRALADRVGVAAMTICKLERGEMAANDALAGKVVEATGFPGAFFERPPQELPPPLYRKRSTMGRRRLDTLQALASICVEAQGAITRAVGVKLPPKIPEGRREDIERTAAECRAAFQLAPDEPVPHVVALVEQAGCVVIQLPSAEARFDGFSTWADCVPVIVTDSGAPGVGDRHRFTVAHELGHLVLHRDVVIDLKQAEEEANRFAAAFLLPRKAIYDDLRRATLTPQGLAPLKVKWRVAISALFMRARHLGLADEHRAVVFFKDMSRRGWRKREPIDIPLERPIVLRKALEALRKKRPADMKAVVPIHISELVELIGFRVV